MYYFPNVYTKVAVVKNIISIIVNMPSLNSLSCGEYYAPGWKYVTKDLFH